MGTVSRRTCVVRELRTEFQYVGAPTLLPLLLCRPLPRPSRLPPFFLPTHLSCRRPPRCLSFATIFPAAVSGVPDPYPDEEADEGGPPQDEARQDIVMTDGTSRPRTTLDQEWDDAFKPGGVGMPSSSEDESEEDNSSHEDSDQDEDEPEKDESREYASEGAYLEDVQQAVSAVVWCA